MAQHGAAEIFGPAQGVADLAESVEGGLDIDIIFEADPPDVAEQLAFVIEAGHQGGCGGEGFFGLDQNAGQVVDHGGFPAGDEPDIGAIAGEFPGDMAEHVNIHARGFSLAFIDLALTAALGAEPGQAHLGAGIEGSLMPGVGESGW